MKKLLLLIFGLFALNQYSYASMMGSYDPGLINSQYMKEIKIFERTKEKPMILSDKPLEKTFTLKEVIFENNTACSPAELNALVSGRIGQEMAPSDIADLERTVTRYYQNKGYTSAIVNVSHKNKQTGTITLSIQEGPENSIRVEETPVQNIEPANVPIINPE